MAFATANLSVKDICTALGVLSPRAIFYKGAGLTTLKTINDLQELVKNGLNPTYCAGADYTAQLNNLLTGRNLKYFKGYEHLTVSDVELYFSISAQSTSVYIKSNGGWTIYKNNAFITISDISGAGNKTFSIGVTENLFNEPRSGVVTVSNGIYSYDINIYQAAFNEF